MFLNLHAVLGADTRAVAWISLQPDGSISVGLSDRVFISPSFRERQFVWNLYNRITVEYLVAHTPQALKAIANPHLTFHPPIRFHLRENNSEVLFAGIAEPRLMLTFDERVPWIRFTSKEFTKLKAAGAPRSQYNTQDIDIQIPHEQCSIAIGIDFVRPDATPATDTLMSRIITWHEHCVHVFALTKPPQVATLSWFHQS